MVSHMEMDAYQEATGSFAVYPGQGGFYGLVYTTLGLCGESGEFAEKVKKLLRDGVRNMPADEQARLAALETEAGALRMKYVSPDNLAALLKELGDTLWYQAQAAKECSAKLSEVAQTNLDKLTSRQVRNVLHGSGDNR